MPPCRPSAHACPISPSSTSRSRTRPKAASTCAATCGNLSAELPIIFLTARDSELDAVSGLRLGADDFLTKDVSLPHLAARVAALFRRIDALRRPGGGAETVRRGALVIDAEQDADHLERQAGDVVAHRVLDRARARPQSRPREEPPAAHGRGERGAGRQHHHLARQAAAPQIPWRSIRPSMPFRPCMAWAIAGSSEHPLTTLDRRIDHLDPAVGGLPVRSRAREHAADGAGERRCEASADTIAHALAAEPQRVVPRRGGHRAVRRNRTATCTCIRCTCQPLLDGYREDWDIAADPAALPSAGGSEAQAAARQHRSLSFRLSRASTIRIRSPTRRRPASIATGWISYARARGRRRSTPTSSPPARRGSFKRRDGQGRTTASCVPRREPRIQAPGCDAAPATSSRRACRFDPRADAGSGSQARDQRAGKPSGFTGADPPHGGRPVHGDARARRLLAALIRAGTRATVVDATA